MIKMINHKNKRIALFYIITSLIFSLAFISINSLAYDLNETETITLNEYENVGYGVLDGNRLRENQLLETQYATDVRYVKQTTGSTTHSMANDSSIFRTNLASSYYDDNFVYDIEQSTWRYNPIYIQAFNNTGTGPNLSFTTGVNDQGTLTLGSETAVEMEADTYYVFKVRLQAGEMYDLNMKSISSVSYYIYFNDYLSRSGSVNGETRNIQPLAARGSGDYYIYLFSNNDNYVVFDPVKIEVSSISAGAFVAGDFVNEPNNIWDEERQVFVDNDNSEHVDAYFVRIPKGVYEFKYIRFDGGISTNAYGMIPSLYYEAGLSHTYFNIEIGSSYDDKFVFSFEYDTKVLVYITAERDNNDYIEFDYIFSVDKLDCPTLKAGEIFEYEDNFLCFGIDVKETQLTYFNISVAGPPVMVWFVDYKDNNLGYGSYYMLDDNALTAAKLLLQPGYYYFFNPYEGVYDFDIEYNVVLVEEFTNSFDFELSQRDGDPSNYMLIKIVNADFDYHNYNLSLFTELNRTVEFGYYIYLENNLNVFWGTTDFVGYQQVAGIDQGYPVNDTQILNFLSTGESTTRYVLFEIYDIYNNTGYSWPSAGSAFSEPENVTLSFSTDTDNPEIFANVNLNLEELDFIENGSYLVNHDFDTTYNDFDIYMIRATVPENTWYRVEIVIINGLRDNSLYSLENPDGYFPGYFYRDAVWNRYYFLDGLTPTHYINYDANVTRSTFDIEFGVFDPNLIFMFGVDHTALNGSIEFKFIPIDCTPISSIASVVMQGLGLGGIIALAAIGGVIGFGILIVVVFRVVIPKIKSKTPASPPSQY